MSPHATPGTIVLVALKTITLILGGMITYFSYKAYRRSGAQPLWYLAVGFGIVTAGTFLAGAIDQAIRFSLFGVNVPLFGGNVDNQTVADFALAIESMLTAAGFAVIVYSLYSE